MKKLFLVVLIFGILILSNFSLCYKANSFSTPKTFYSSENLTRKPKGMISGVEDLKPGDILFHVSQYIVIHCLIFKQFNSTNNMYEFIEANSEKGVRRIFYSENTLNNTLIYRKFARVKTANTTQKQNAILFAESQMGKKFEWDMFFHHKKYIPNNTDDPFSNSWYCTELIWAAYYNCNHTPDMKIYGEGIDIDRNKWRRDCLIWCFVWPNDILWDDDVKVFYLRKSKIYNYPNLMFFSFFRN